MSVIANLKVMLGADSSELTSTFKKTDKQSKKWAAAQKRRNKATADSFKMIAQSVKTGMTTDSMPIAKPAIITVAAPVSPAAAIVRIGLPAV